MSYSNLIGAMADPLFNGLTSDADFLDAGNVIVSLPPDMTQYQWDTLGAKLIENGMALTDYLNLAANIGTLPGGPALSLSLSSGGFCFGSAIGQGWLESELVSEPSWAAADLNAMLAIGKPSGTSWALWGLPQPVLADITSARASYAAQLSNQAQQSQIALFMNEVLNPLIGTGTATATSIKAIVSAWSAT